MGTAEEFDLGAEGEASASPDALERVRESIAEMIALEEGIAQLEDDLKAAKKQLQFVRTGKLPDLMAEIQSGHFTHAGWEVKLTEFVSGSLPKDPAARQKALDWLESHDGGELIKTDVKLSFAKSQHNEALSVAGGLAEEGYAPIVESGVHAQTLQKYARDRIADGDEIDFEVLGLYAGRVAKATKVSK